MHELPVVESILDIVLRTVYEKNIKKVKSVNLVIGELCHLEGSWLQCYFNYLSKDTAAEGALIVAERSPVRVSCTHCGREYQLNLQEIQESLSCKKCKSNRFKIVSGQEFYLKDMEVI